MEQAIIVRKMAAAEIESVTSIYTDALHPGYISFSELAEGKAEGPGKVSEQARAIFREQLFEMLANESYGLFVATVGETIVGFSLASLHQAEAGHTECWLDDLTVRQQWQGNGIGNALLARMLDWGKQGKARYFLSEVSWENEAIDRMLERLGFQPLARVFWRGGTD